MPQLVPFFFVHESITAFVLISLLVYIASKYILPRFLRLFVSRLITLRV